MAQSVSAEKHRNRLIMEAIIAVIIVVAVYFIVTYYASVRTTELQGQIQVLQANNSRLVQNYQALEGKYAVLQVDFNGTYAAYVNLRGQLNNPSPRVLYQGKSIVLQTLLYPSFVNEGYNVSYLAFFEPTGAWIYYNSFKYPNYSPLEYINASHSYYNFNFTAPESGYITVNYTSNSQAGLEVASNGCSSGLSRLYSFDYAARDLNSSGSITIPVNGGPNCVYIENPGNSGIGVRFSATFYGYIGS